MTGNEPTSHNDGVPYVPVEQIPIEWRPPEHSPRLMSWSNLPIEWFSLLSLGMGKDNFPLSNALRETINRLCICSQRLHDSYLAWFEPIGPPGTHAHIHYRPPQDPAQKSILQSAMVIDYEAYLIFLDTALELASRAIGIHARRGELTWRKLLLEAEKLPVERASWLPDEAARAARQLQRTALYARNKAIVHPKLHYVVLRTDNVGNVTYLRIPAAEPDADSLADLDALWRSKFQVRDDVTIGEDPAGWKVVQMLDQISGDLNQTERVRLEHARDKVGFALPSIPMINSSLESLLAGVCNAISGTASKSTA